MALPSQAWPTTLQPSRIEQGPGHAAAVTPHDDNDLAVPATRLYVGVSGHLTLLLAGDTAVVLYKNVPVGWTRPMQVRRVMATGTTATDIVAEWN